MVLAPIHPEFRDTLEFLNQFLQARLRAEDPYICSCSCTVQQIHGELIKMNGLVDLRFSLYNLTKCT